ncbi:acyltransferase [Spiroplasma sp. BIUS-1]|uniref:acyltransferase family protein n=1 Tax=Spiroplasma sp. BIUS-1 TaxID=216964 RepID=UPI001398339F|nr:acyltransferase [Spiroplasma sp. BIUS-1]QHX37018.1 hypothetical protein SBIUS_v1c07650 [Spiroplasma sp. BIUS-1]
MRKSNIELLRFLMCITVVLYHTRVGQSYSFSLFSPIIGSGVLLFGIISGYFMVNKKWPGITKLILTILFYLGLIIVLNLLLEFIFIGKVDGFGNRHGTSGWLFHHGTVNMWYIWSLLFVYIASLGINWFLTHTNAWYALFSIFLFYLVFMLAINQLQYYKNFSMNNIFYLSVVYMFGGWLKLHREKLKLKKIDILWVASISWISLVMFVNLIIVIVMGPGVNPFFGNNNFSSVFTAISMFYLFTKINIRENKIYYFLGKLSIPIYFLHWSLIDLIRLSLKSLSFNKEIYFLVVSLVDFFITLLISLIVVYPIDWTIKKIDGFLNKSYQKIYQFITYKINLIQKNQ